MNVLATCGQAFFLLTSILGIMALIYLALCIINQKRGRRW